MFDGVYTSEMRPDLDSYDYIIVASSGGKDSIAALLHTLEAGADPAKVELWHHGIDGKGERFMDWPCTESYCRAFARAFNLPIRFQWKEGGFKREMTRHESRTAPMRFELPDGTLGSAGGNRGKPNTRMQFPQVSADLSVRWCSAYLKIDVCAATIRNDPRFRNKRTLVVTGERAEESTARSKYNTFEPDRAHSNGKRVKRHVDHWRPVHKWSEAKVWAIMEKYRVNPHPAYHLGFGRVSCMSCIFGGDDQWHTVRKLSPDTFMEIAQFEETFGKFHESGRPKTIHRKLTVIQRANQGCSLIPADIDPDVVRVSMSEDYDHPVILPADVDWKLPAGAFKETGGPT